MKWRKKDELPLGMTPDDLPGWMRPARREPDWALWVAGALCLLVMWPLLARPGLPRNAETQALVYRTVEIVESLQDGVLYPRWSPDFNLGYGSPLFNYVAPMPHYLAGVIRILFQVTVENSVKTIFVLGMLLNGVGFFSFVRRRWGPIPGILSVAIYLFNPQLLLVKPYLQGDLSGLLAMGWFWVLLWALDRVLTEESRSKFALVAVSVACLWLAHGPLSIVLTGIALGWLVVRGAATPGTASRAQVVRAVLAVGEGIGVAAFFWLPAWVERSAIRWTPFPGFSDELSGPIPLGELLMPPQRVDLAAINPVQTGALGVGLWMLGLVAVLAIFIQGWNRVVPARGTMSRGDALQRRVVHLGQWIARDHAETAYFGVVGLVSLLAVLPWAESFWKMGVEWPRFVPRDLLWIMIGCWAIEGATLATLLDRARSWGARLAGANIIVGFVALAALPVAYPPEWPARHTEPTREEIVRDELRGLNVTGQSGGWVLPRDVDLLPAPSPTLLTSYQSGILDKIARDAIPAATQIDIVEHASQRERLVIQARAPVDVTLLTLNFPGWNAYLNDQEIPIATDPGTGLMVIHVPEGRYDAKIVFGSTAARSVGWLIALASTIFIIAVMMVRPAPRESLEPHSAASSPANQTSRATGGRVVLLSVVLWAGMASTLPHLLRETFTMQSAPGTVAVSENPLPRALQGGIDLLAYDLDAGGSVKPGSQVRLTLYWRAVRPDLPDYQVDVILAPPGETGNAASLVRRRHPGMIPSSTWPVWPLLDYYVRDTYSIPVAADAPASEYEVHIQVGRCSQVGAASCDTIIPLFVRDGRGSSLGQHITLPEPVEVGS